MNTAVLIDLDYQLNPAEACYTAWKILQQCFIDAGFRIQERLFIIAEPLANASELARQALQRAEHRLLTLGLDMGSVVEACSTFEYKVLFPLPCPQPSTTGIEVSFMDTGTFAAWRGVAQAA